MQPESLLERLAKTDHPVETKFVGTHAKIAPQKVFSMGIFTLPPSDRLVKKWSA